MRKFIDIAIILILAYMMFGFFTRKVAYGNESYNVGDCLGLQATKGTIHVKVVDRTEDGIFVEDVIGQGAFFSYRNLEINKKLVAKTDCKAYDNLRKQNEGKL